ncbi:HPP family protein [Pseudomonas sp. MMS21-TM103]|uniref:HPP family protein n=1 Tax=Pseudomonas sp. MMS21 TM103 TaxID=2886506 RepID=UPI001EDF9B1D|nr:CBS domain-containing protein [Pseudomonas sp. MMS21 TM103]MCG4455950.1 HPP family protein [Pseudomonas sp. MMS21 TM103]
MQEQLLDWFRSFTPAPLNARAQEWLRVAIGIALGMSLCVSIGISLFGAPITLHIAAPVAASAVLLFGASSSPFAQPWSILAGNMCAALIGISLGLSTLDSVTATVLAASLSLFCLFALRCLHPPSCALAVVAASGGLGSDLGYAVLYQVAFSSLLLVAIALLYNNLTGHIYPKPRRSGENRHHTRDPLPAERLSFSRDDMDRALEEFGEYVDVTRDDLARLIKQTEKHALRRSMGEISAADIMSRDLYSAAPDSFIQQAWQTLREHHLRSLPVVEEGSGKLIGIVTLIDLLKQLQPSRARVNVGRLKYPRGTKLRSIMSAPVVAVKQDVHMVELVFLLCDRGLHCLPVVDEHERLVGMITQTDLIAALYRNWLKQLAD